MDIAIRVKPRYITRPILSLASRVVDILLFSLLLMTLGLSPAPAQASAFVQAVPGIFVRIGAHREMNPLPHPHSPAAAAVPGGIANIGFIVGQRSIAVIDPGGSSADATQLLDEISKHSPLPVSHLILTHFHPDHVLAGQAFAHVPAVIAHRRYGTAMAQRGAHYLDQFASLLSPAVQASWLLPTVEVADSLEIDLGKRKLLIQAHATAHTDNDLSVLDKSTNTLWASDLVFSERIPVLDGNLAGWLAVLDKLEALQPDLVIPGHGQPADWQQTAGPQINYLQDLLASTRQTLSQGKSLSRAIAELDFSAGSDWLLYQRFHPRNVTKAYSELEWE